MTWRLNDPQGQENLKIKYDIVPYTRGRGLDVGCGGSKTYAHMIGVDNLHHAIEFGWDMHPDVVVQDACDLGIFASESMDFVFSSHLLEHIQLAPVALSEWWRLIKPGGYLVLYLPDDALYPKCGTEGANPDHKHDLNRTKVVDWMKEVGSWDLLVNEQRNTDNGPGEYGNEYSFYQVYQKREDLQANVSDIQPHLFTCIQPRPKKTACVVRYGGFGDMIQASSVLPPLKEQGYHVTVMTTPRGQEMLKANPYVDDFVIQDTDQVPNNELVGYWAAWRKRFDRFINLSESVEGSLLAMPGRTAYYWPVEARRAMLDVNYLEMTHEIAQVPKGEYFAHFFPTAEEMDWSDQMRETVNPGHKPLIVWSLAGSSVHKTWPWLDTVLARLMLDTECLVVLVGDEYCQILEQGWKNEPRVIRASGIWDIRQSITFAQRHADLVIGTETGLLNAVGLEDVHKIVTLSHSSDNNLTKHWENVIALTPDAKQVPCFPCHQMHYGFTNCRMDEETHCAMCQVKISPDSMWMAIIRWHNHYLNG